MACLFCGADGPEPGELCQGCQSRAEGIRDKLMAEMGITEEELIAFLNAEARRERLLEEADLEFRRQNNLPPPGEDE